MKPRGALKKAAVVGLFLVSSLVVPVVATGTAEAATKPLVASAPVWTALSYCQSYDSNGAGVYSMTPPCRYENWGTYYKKPRYYTIWAFSVRNPNTSKGAKNVRARVRLLDKNGNILVNKVVAVSSLLAPGQTAWVAPTVGYSSYSYSSLPFELEPSESSGAATSMSVSILKPSWVKAKRVRTKVTDIEFSSTALSCCNYDEEVRGSYVAMAMTSTIPNPSKDYQGYVTRVFYDDAGRPLGGLRTRTTVQAGSTAWQEETVFPAAVGNQIGEMKMYVSK